MSSVTKIKGKTYLGQIGTGLSTGPWYGTLVEGVGSFGGKVFMLVVQNDEPFLFSVYSFYGTIPKKERDKIMTKGVTSWIEKNTCNVFNLDEELFTLGEGCLESFSEDLFDSPDDWESKHLQIVEAIVEYAMGYSEREITAESGHFKPAKLDLSGRQFVILVAGSACFSNAGDHGLAFQNWTDLKEKADKFSVFWKEPLESSLEKEWRNATSGTSSFYSKNVLIQYGGHKTAKERAEMLSKIKDIPGDYKVVCVTSGNDIEKVSDDEGFDFVISEKDLWKAYNSEYYNPKTGISRYHFLGMEWVLENKLIK